MTLVTILKLTLEHILSTHTGKQLLPDMLELCKNKTMTVQLEQFINEICHVEFNTLMSEPHKLCGTAKFTDSKLIELTIDNTLSTTTNTTSHCNHKYNDRIIWHAHLSTSKIYPNVEDVLQLLNSPNIINCSIILCEFGYFLMINDSQISKTDIENISRDIIHINTNLYNKFYKNKTRIERTKFHKTAPLPSTIDSIDKYTTMLTNKISKFAPNFKIKFYQIKFIKKITPNQYLII